MSEGTDTERIVLPYDGVLDALALAELGADVAAVFRSFRQAEEARYRAAHPDEGLRERKRRHTRQVISDIATTLCVSRGFDAVRVSEIAERVGVSEKTVYNYFPTKEAMVLDASDDLAEQLVQALRGRAPGTSISAAMVAALAADMENFELVNETFAAFVPRFVAMIEGTPALRARWLETHDELGRVAAEELAAQSGLGPADPEAVVAGRALLGLVEVDMESRVRHIEAGLRGEPLRAAVTADIQRAADLLDAGLAAFARPQPDG